jgi:hypothetical protein
MLPMGEADLEKLWKKVLIEIKIEVSGAKLFNSF